MDQYLSIANTENERAGAVSVSNAVDAVVNGVVKLQNVTQNAGERDAKA